MDTLITAAAFVAGILVATTYLCRRWEDYCDRITHTGRQVDRQNKRLILTEKGLRDTLERANIVNHQLAEECDTAAQVVHTDAAQYIRYLLSQRGNKVDIPDAALQEDSGMIWVHHDKETSTTTITVETPCGSVH